VSGSTSFIVACTNKILKFILASNQGITTSASVIPDEASNLLGECFEVIQLS